MRKPSRLVIAAPLVVVLTLSASSAFASCHTSDLCASLYTSLRTSIVTLVPTELQMSMLSKTIASQRLLPGDPCRALLPLNALSNQVEGLATANVIDEPTTVTLSTDIDALVAAIPTDPC